MTAVAPEGTDVGGGGAEMPSMRHVGWQTREQAKASGDAFSLSTRRLAAEWAAAQMASQRTAGVPAPARRKAAPASKIAPKSTARPAPGRGVVRERTGVARTIHVVFEIYYFFWCRQLWCLFCHARDGAGPWGVN